MIKSVHMVCVVVSPYDCIHILSFVGVVVAV